MLTLSAHFDCSTAQKSIQYYYDELTYLPIGSMLGSLYGKGVITFEHLQSIRANNSESSRMECFLDRVIIPSLKLNFSIKFEGFLEVMRESGDSTLASMALKLGKWLCM